MKLCYAVVASGFVWESSAQNVLRLLSWSDYATKDVLEQITQETGISVEVTLSNNEEMIYKLRATRNAGFQEFAIYADAKNCTALMEEVAKTLTVL